MIKEAIAAYESKYGTEWQAAPPNCQRLWLDAWELAMKRAIHAIETYRVSVGNSCAGELAAEWTMESLREIRSELYEIMGQS